MADPRDALGGATLTATSVTWQAAEVPTAWSSIEVPIVDPAHYRIIGEVARGGVGRILEAVDTRLQREVALKQLLRSGTDEARFIREAVLTARLQHPSIIPIYEVGVFASGGPFIAMKLVRGQSLRDAILKCPDFATRLELVSALVSAAEAVAYAHSQRVIHRDLKPANMLLGSFGEVVVIDWGLAKHLDAPEERPVGEGTSPTAESTATGAIIGTPAYMPPEQALGRVLDERADVYALGAILYQVLTGRVPISGTSVEEVLCSLLTRPPVPVEHLVREVNPDLAAVVHKAMMPAPEARYASAAEFAAELRRVELGQPVMVGRVSYRKSPAIEQAFQKELRARATLPLRVIAGLTLVNLVAFAAIVRWHLGRSERTGSHLRFLVFGLVAAMLAGTFSKRIMRRSQELSMLLVFLGGTLTIELDAHERIEGLFTGIMMLVFLGITALTPLSPGRVVVALSAVMIEFVASAALTGRELVDWSFVSEATLFGAAFVSAVTGAILYFRVRRAEFYNRYYLQQANERLARIDRPR